jgi:hypothetical protein
MPSGDLESPRFKAIVSSTARHHDIGGFVKQRADHGVAAFCYPADLFDFPGSMNPGCEAELEQSLKPNAEGRPPLGKPR